MVGIGECTVEGLEWDGNVLVETGYGGTSVIDQILGSVQIHTTRQHCTVYALGQDGTRKEQVTVHKADDGFDVYLDNESTAVYYEIIFE